MFRKFQPAADGGEQGPPVALGEARRQPGDPAQFFKRARAVAGQVNHQGAAEDLVGRPVAPLSLALAPLQQLLRHSQLAPAEDRPPLEAQTQRPLLAGEAHRLEEGELLPGPFEPAQFDQPRLPELRQPRQMAGVLGRVVDHVGGERTDRPVGTLEALVEADPEVLGEDVGQADLLLAEELSGDHGVEEPAHLEAEVAVQAAQVVIGGVEDLAHRRVGEERGQRGQLRAGEGVDEHGAAGGGQLQQADLLAVAVLGVGLEIDGQNRFSPQAGGEGGDLRSGGQDRYCDCH